MQIIGKKILMNTLKKNEVCFKHLIDFRVRKPH